MKITEPDFTMEPDGNRFNLIFNKKVKKRDTGKFEIEPGPPLYGLTLASALNRIIHHRTAKKFADENVTLKQYLKELQKNYEEIVKLCRETLPEKFDTGE